MNSTSFDVIVVGAGPVGESKIVRLLDCEAVVKVVAPLATPQVQAWHAEGRVRWSERPFEDRDLDGVVFVMTATGCEVDDTVLAAVGAGVDGRIREEPRHAV